jgi:argininosuccinate lyase
MLPEKFCTGSSIMPQKKNPDVLELIRANYHTVNGYGAQVKSLSANLISGYNRDLQLAKKPVISSLNIAKTSLDMMTYIITNLTASKENCLNDLTEDLFATDEVYNLVKEGIPFRDAYRTIAKKLSGK